MNADEIILAIETSGPRGSAALARGAELLEQSEFSLVHNHARELLPAVDRLCQSHRVRPGDIRRLDVSIGPGSFTGLRVAVAFARHLALATGTRIVAVPTFEAIAFGISQIPDPPVHLAVIVDAKRGEVYAETFALDADARAYRVIRPPHLSRPETLLANAPKPIAVAGEGLVQHRAATEAAGAQLLDEGLWYSQARHLLQIGGQLATAGQFTPPRDLIPLYVRRPEAEERWEALHRNA